MKDTITYGNIWWVSFAPSMGHEFQGRRPATVIQADSALRRTNLVTVMPLTSQVIKLHGDDILIKADKRNNLYVDSLVKVHHIESFDRARFLKQIGHMNNGDMEKIREYLTVHFALKT